VHNTNHITSNKNNAASCFSPVAFRHRAEVIMIIIITVINISLTPSKNLLQPEAK
jgi:hypothetical protein